MPRSIFLALWISFVRAGYYDSWTCANTTSRAFALRLLDSTNSTTSTYTPGRQQVVEVYSTGANITIYSVIAVAFNGNFSTCPRHCGDTVGFLIPSGERNSTRIMRNCTGGTTYNSTQNSTSLRFNWTAPPNQFTPVSVWMIIVSSASNYGAVSKIISPPYKLTTATISAVHPIQTNSPKHIQRSYTPTPSSHTPPSNNSQSAPLDTKPVNSGSSSNSPLSSTLGGICTLLGVALLVDHLCNKKYTNQPTKRGALPF